MLIRARFGENEKSSVENYVSELRTCDIETVKMRQESAGKSRTDKFGSQQRLRRCKYCSNADDAFFLEDFSRAEITCTKCGTVFQDNMIRDEDWTRQYEGDVNPSQHGPPPDARFTSAHNLSTVFALPEGVKGSKTALRDMWRIAKEAEEVCVFCEFGYGLRRSQSAKSQKIETDVEPRWA